MPAVSTRPFGSGGHSLVGEAGGRLRQQVREAGVTTLPGHVEPGRAERAAHALLGERRGMHRVVEEPRAVVVPEMMIRVVRIDADPEERAGGGEGGTHDA